MTSLKQVRLPVSKSLYIRKLIFDFLNNGRVGEIPNGAPADVQVVHDALEVIADASKRIPFGAEVDVSVSSETESERYAADESKSGMDKDRMRESAENTKHRPVVVDVHDCGAAYRFLMAVLAVTPGLWLLTGTERLLQRPIEELVQCLQSIGADIQGFSDDDDVISCRDVPWRVSTTNDDEVFGGDARPCVSTESMPSGWLIHGKPLHASELTIDCHRSGQLASALWLISNKIGLKNLYILPENPSSLSYIEMTKAVVNGTENLIEGRLADWSAAVYWYAHLLLSQVHKGSLRTTESDGMTYTDLSYSVTVPASCSTSKNVDVQQPYKLLHLDLYSNQSDAVIAKWFANWGIESRQEEDGVVISYNERFNKPQEVVELDMSQNLDLVPVLACMACLWPKKMVFNGVANLKYKESDRLQQLCNQLAPFAYIEVEKYENLDGNRLIINPNQQIVYPNKLYFDANEDHRLVMAFSLFALKCPVFIKGFGSVRKSYPNFHAEGVIGGTDIVG